MKRKTLSLPSKTEGNPPNVLTDEAAEILLCSVKTIYARHDPRSRSFDPTFPKPIKIGPRRLAYRRQELIDWMSSQDSEAASPEDPQ